MSTDLVSREQLEARMQAASQKQDASLASGTGNSLPVLKIKPGSHALRFLPGKGYPENMQWVAKFGMHFFKGVGKNGVMFRCDYHSEGQSCPICKAGFDARDAAKESGNAQAEKFARSIGAQPKLLMNVIDLNDQAKGVQLVQASKSFYDFLRQFQDMVNKLFVDPTYGSALMIQVSEKTNGIGYDYRVLQHTPYDVSTSIKDDDLFDLEAAKEKLLSNMLPVSDFTGDIFNPLRPDHPRLNTQAAAANGGGQQPAGSNPFGGQTQPAPAASPQTIDADYSESPASANAGQPSPAEAAPAQPAEPQPTAEAAPAQPTQTQPSAEAQPAPSGTNPFGNQQQAASNPFGGQTQAAPAQPAQQPSQPAQQAEQPTQNQQASNGDSDDLEAKLMAMVS